MKRDFFKNLIRALRLPFVSASILPFSYGSMLAINSAGFSWIRFLLGFIAVLSAHLSANLINDFADSKSQADWLDKSYYGFFGGSKLIQTGVFTEQFYFKLSLFFAFLSACMIFALAIIMASYMIIFYFLIILFLSWAYSAKPLQLVYRGCGEFVVFILFGPASVMGGYFIQTQIFPELKGLMLSLPFGFLVTAILFANEVPDFPQDYQAGKATWVKFSGTEKAYLIYAGLIALGFLTIILNFILGYTGLLSLLSLLLIFPAIKACFILKNNYQNKSKLLLASKLTILTQTLVGLILLVSLFFSL